MTQQKESCEIKICCATFYESDIVRLLLGDILHPGGLALTAYLGQLMGLSPEDRVLDIACGRGSSAVHLAQKFGCHVTGVDYGEDNISAAKELTAAQGVSHLTAFRQGDAERLPFEDSTFDALFSECSYCTFPDKDEASKEMVRVLKSNGRLGVTDITINNPLPNDVQSLLGWVSCIAGAGSANEYVSQLQKAGFASFTVEDKREALIEMVNDVRRKFLALEMAVGLKKLNLRDFNLLEAKRLARRALELIDEELISYSLIIAKKEVSQVE